MIKITINVFIVSLVSSACIEPYTPDISEYREMIVINGKITDQEGYHYVEVSRSSSFNDSEPRPERDCEVKVYDDKGNSFIYNEIKPGNYRCWIEKSYLNPYTRYMVEVKTNDDRIYRSDFDQMLPCADIDTIYYEISEEAPTDPLYDPYPGLQFFIDTKVSENGVSNFRWELTETWEYHSKYLLGDYYDGEINFVLMESYSDSLYYCWNTGVINEIFTMSTKNLATNKITRGYLNFVSNQTDKLRVRYSLLVRQYSLSDSACEYWGRMQRLSQESGGLYETQPMQVTGNMKNMNNPEETVLGYFWASALKEKRIFYKRDYLFPVKEPDCDLYNFSNESLMEYLSFINEEEYPVYLVNLTYLPEGPWDLADQECFDCRKRGGTTIRPDFWEQ